MEHVGLLVDVFPAVARVAGQTVVKRLDCQSQASHLTAYERWTAVHHKLGEELPGDFEMA